MKAMILAAGKGTRLGEITTTIPKVLVDINGKSLLRLAVEKCSRYGFDDIIINVHHYADQVEAEVAILSKEGFKITISDEREQLLETGGGLFKARNFFDKDPFLLYNADTVSDTDLKALYLYHVKMNGIATLAVRNREGKRYFLVNREGILKGWINKSTGEKIIIAGEMNALSEIAFSGMHIIEPGIFDYMKDGIYTMTELYLQLASSHNIYTWRDDSGNWVNVGTPDNIETARRLFK